MRPEMLRRIRSQDPQATARYENNVLRARIQQLIDRIPTPIDSPIPEAKTIPYRGYHIIIWPFAEGGWFGGVVLNSSGKHLEAGDNFPSAVDAFIGARDRLQQHLDTISH